MRDIKDNWKAYGRFLRGMHELEEERVARAEKWDELYRDILRAGVPYSLRFRYKLYLSLFFKPIKRLWRKVNLATNW